MDQWKKKGEALVVTVAVGGFAGYLSAAGAEYSSCAPNTWAAAVGITAVLGSVVLTFVAGLTLYEALLEGIFKKTEGKPLRNVMRFVGLCLALFTVWSSSDVARWKYLPIKNQYSCDNIGSYGIFKS